MALVDHEKGEVRFKIVYCGPALSGKTTSLQFIHSRIEEDRRGDLLSMATPTDRTVFFDYLPIDAVMIRGYLTKFQLYSVPGQTAYHSTRELVLRGADGVVFVADSSPWQAEHNAVALELTEDNLRANGLSMDRLPMVFQYNKRDLPDALAPSHLNLILNQRNPRREVFESVANRGYNVFATLNAVAQQVLRRFHDSMPERDRTPRNDLSGQPA